jgi:hypothetical protein
MVRRLHYSKARDASSKQKIKRKGGCYENQDEREGWTHDEQLAPTGGFIQISGTNRPRLVGHRRKAEAKSNQEGKENAMKTKTNVKAGTRMANDGSPN